MDRSPLIAHEVLWGSEQSQVTNELLNLTPTESALYEDLRGNRIRNKLRLEQELIGYTLVEATVAQLIR
jgi:hypothetical protein